MDFGDRFKMLRKQSGFTQKNVSVFMDVDQSFTSKIEKGERSLTSAMINKVSSLFGVPVTAFEAESSCCPKINCAFPLSDLSFEDLQTISVINKIALNANLMTTLVGE